MTTSALAGALAALALAGAASPLGTGPNVAALEPRALSQARVIRGELNARYRTVGGRRLTVRDATSTAGVGAFTLVDDWLAAPRLVPAANGIYFAICAPGRACPYPPRRASWRPTAFLPLRLACELALRALAETSASVVVVSLPTREPVWAVYERADLEATVDAGHALRALARHPAHDDALLRSLVADIGRPRLYAPIPVLPPRAAVYAVRLFPD